MGAADCNTLFLMSVDEIAMKAEGLHFAYSGKYVLEGIDLEVKRGDFFGLLGPNGAGKTTLVQLVSGVERPVRGRVILFGRDGRRMSRRDRARLVAVVPQRLEGDFGFTVMQLVLLGRVPHRRPWQLDGTEDLQIAAECMKELGVEHLANRQVHQLSGGELKRVLVAKALAQRPKLLVLDEPAAHLDIRHQVELLNLLERVRRQQGLTVFAVLHDLNLAAAFCNRVALLKDGRIFRSGTIEQVMTYRNLSETFDTDIYVGVNEITGHRTFTPMVRT
ncbi:MAG: ABC transporter ATP-binding protein [Deltaproteobacteria bacterium]|nr:MAG: ABC transporter ATP-binding protein [Deltaproteobacteria bacterium]